MKKSLTIILLLATTLPAGALQKENKYHTPIKVEKKWKKYNPGDVIFKDEAPETDGSKIYRSIIPSQSPTYRRMPAGCCRRCISVPKTRTSHA